MNRDKKKHKIRVKVGLNFNRWHVIKDRGRNSNGERIFLCECLCPKHTKRVVDEKSLAHGISRSCGCIEREKHTLKSDLGGLSNHSLYRVWGDMIRRCYSPTYKEYYNYGYRGIFIVPEWYTPGVPGNPGFMAFFKWAIKNGYKKGLEIDRRDNNGNYCPENCQWVTKQENVNNRRNSPKILIDNVIYNQIDIDRMLRPDVPKDKKVKGAVYGRMQTGYTIDSIIHEVKTGERIKRNKRGELVNQFGERRLLRKYPQPNKPRFYKNDTYYHLELPKYKHLLRYAPHITEPLMERK